MTSFSGRTHKSGSRTRRPFTFNRPARMALRASARDARPKRESTRSSVIVLLGVGLLDSESGIADPRQPSATETEKILSLCLRVLWLDRGRAGRAMSLYSACFCGQLTLSRSSTRSCWRSVATLIEPHVSWLETSNASYSFTWNTKKEKQTATKYGTLRAK